MSAQRARELAFALLVAGLLALSPVTGSARLLPSILLGAAGGVTFFLWRRRDPPPTAGASGAGPRIDLGWTGLALLTAVASVFAPTVAWLFAQYTDSIWRNADGIFIPLFMVLLARGALRRDSSPEREASAWGFAFLVPALALALVDSAVGSHYIASFGLVLALPGLSLLLLGARRSRRLALPLALGLFLIPVPASFETALGLPLATAVAMEPLLDLLGVPAVRHHSSFHLSTGWLGVSRNCSGLATLHAAVALAVVMAIAGRAGPRRFLPLLLALPLTLVTNALRGVSLAILCGRFGHEVLLTPLHGLSGIVAFWLVIGGLAWVGDLRALRERMA